MNNDFLGYMSYRADIEDIIDECVAAARSGEDSIEITSVYDLSDEDIEYIENEVAKRI